MSINYTWPRRLHIIHRPDLTYITVRVFDRRFHRCWSPAPSGNVREDRDHE